MDIEVRIPQAYDPEEVDARDTTEHQPKATIALSECVSGNMK